jgi:azurin
MIYDRKEFTVVAGKPVHIVLENPDAMPHNLLIVRPGKVEAVGTLAEKLGADGFDKNFRPETDDILHATKLVQPGESATLTFTAPAVPGDYGYVCTFPGHWRLMNGLMHVVAATK